jgi:hypothetical protein
VVLGCIGTIGWLILFIALVAAVARTGTGLPGPVAHRLSGPASCTRTVACVRGAGLGQSQTGRNPRSNHAVPQDPHRGGIEDQARRSNTAAPWPGDGRVRCVQQRHGCFVPGWITRAFTGAACRAASASWHPQAIPDSPVSDPNQPARRCGTTCLSTPGPLFDHRHELIQGSNFFEENIPESSDKGSDNDLGQRQTERDGFGRCNPSDLR